MKKYHRIREIISMGKDKQGTEKNIVLDDNSIKKDFGTHNFESVETATGKAEAFQRSGGTVVVRKDGQYFSNFSDTKGAKHYGKLKKNSLDKIKNIIAKSKEQAKINE